MQRITLAEVQRRQSLARHDVQESNRRAMQRVAAGIPQQRSTAPQGAQNSREAASPARETASTTSTHAGGLSGCSTQSA